MPHWFSSFLVVVVVVKEGWVSGWVVVVGWWWWWWGGVARCRMDITLNIQYIPRNMHTAFALLCFVVVIHWLICPYPSGLLHWHCGNLTIAPVPAKQPWWIWINTSCEFIMNECITTTKQSTTKPCAYFLGYTVHWKQLWLWINSAEWMSGVDRECVQWEYK